jgi:uncharacterized protein
MSLTNLKTNRLAVIALLAEKAPFKNLGRTAVMKCMYFLQTVREVPLGYHFSLYSYGPFDSEVLADLEYAENLNIVTTQVVPYPSGHGYQIEPGPSMESVRVAAAEFLKEHGGDIDWVMDRFGRRSAADLELDSTIIFVDREAVRSSQTLRTDDLAARVGKVKPQFTRERILSHVSSLKELLQSANSELTDARDSSQRRAG